MMRFYQGQHRFYCGMDLHARSMHLCVVDQAGTVVFDKNLAARPECLLRAIEPFRDGLIVGVECMFAWYWVADFCKQHDIAFVLGYALYVKAIHGGKAKNDRIDAAKIARLLYEMHDVSASITRGSLCRTLGWSGAYREARSRVCLAEDLELAGFEASSQHGDQVHGRCPVHRSKRPASRSFAADLRRGVWHCFRCVAGGNVLDLWSAVTGQPLHAV